jgi:hypothetical protein
MLVLYRFWIVGLERRAGESWPWRGSKDKTERRDNE